MNIASGRLEEEEQSVFVLQSLAAWKKKSKAFSCFNRWPRQLQCAMDVDTLVPAGCCRYQEYHLGGDPQVNTQQERVERRKFGEGGLHLESWYCCTPSLQMWQARSR